MRLQQKLTFLLILMILMSACQTAKPFVVSGESLDTLGKEFVSTARIYNRLFDERIVTSDQYRKWADFAVKFQKVYPIAVNSWKSARLANDKAAEQKVNESMVIVAKELASLTSLAYDLLSKGGSK